MKKNNEPKVKIAKRFPAQYLQRPRFAVKVALETTQGYLADWKPYAEGKAPVLKLEQSALSAMRLTKKEAQDIQDALVLHPEFKGHKSLIVGVA